MRSASLGLVLLLGAAPAARAQRDPCSGVLGHMTNGDGARTTVVVAERGRCLELRMTGRATFTDDDGDVRSLDPGATLVAFERAGGMTRMLTLVERDGRIERAYEVNGAARSVDESVAWFRGVVLDLVRETTYGAESRIARIRARGGVAAVLDEVGRLHTSYVRREYLTQLLAAGGLTDDEVRRVADTARERLDSDYDKEVLLRAVAIERGADRGVADAIVRGAATISSDHSRSVVLLALLDRATTDDALMARALDAARDMGSDHERSTVLLAALDRTVPSATPARASFFRTVDAIGSDYERRRVLVATASSEGLGAEGVRAVLGSAARIGSDHDKAAVLLSVATRPERLRDTATRAAFDAALRTVGSDVEYRRVASVVAPLTAR